MSAATAGARILHDEKTTVGNIVCRYHSWTYDLTAQLIHAEHMGPDFDRSCHGLKPVHVRSLEGLLFVCLADDPPEDFDEMARVIGPYIAPHNVREHQGCLPVATSSSRATGS